MSERKGAQLPPPEVVQARIDAWKNLVDMGVAAMIALQKQLHPDHDPMGFVRRALRRQAEDSHQANVRILSGR
ncbi:MAG: hypothetical protein NZT92_08875 [Abditibacteriales bacterium]|nr:hypothetical protein [Abditibacteriales bacterium]MDW8366787.1 hypothetical protein [Abditibacteriales bacterium]